MEEVKQCNCCGEVKPLSEFHKNKTTKDGFQYVCKSCQKAYGHAYHEANQEKAKSRKKAYYEANREEILAKCKVYQAAHRAERKAYNKAYHEANREKNNARNKAYKDTNPDWVVWNAIKHRAKKRGLSFDLEVEDVIPPEFCPVFGLRLERAKGGAPQKTSPSVDRLDPSKGYIKGNTQVISQLANTMKQDATPEQLLMFADWIYKTYKEKQYGKT